VSVFLIWVGSALFFFGVYTLFLWFRRRNRARFRARLTIIFLLFVLTPTIPLTFLLSNLFTRSADMLLVPGITDALDTSLETIRKQTVQEGETFLDELDDHPNWTKSMLESRHIAFLGFARMHDDTLSTTAMIRSSHSALPPQWQPAWSEVLGLYRNQENCRLITVVDSSYYLMIKLLENSRLGVIAYPVEDRIIQAREQIRSARRIYDTLSFLKERILEKNIIWGLAALFIIALAFIAIVISARLSRSISQPVTQMVDGMTHVAEGDLDYRVTYKASDEFRFLIASFNKMASDLQISRRQLVKAERMAAWQEVARQISHEIKNSLTPISISLRRLRNQRSDRPLPVKVTASLNAIEAELRVLEKMAVEFSAFARMPEPKKVSVDVNDIIRTTVLLLSPRFSEHRLITHLSDDIRPIQADAEQLKQVINNLIKNGVDASPPKHAVTVSTKLADSAHHDVEIEVADEGKGLTPSEIEKLFKPYYTTKRGGTGLGLTIVQKIIEAHSGRIQIESEPERGTRIRIQL